MRQQWADYRVFWRQFRETYHSTGAVMPSGSALSAALSRFVREWNERTGSANGDGLTAGRRILEVGPGTGAVTARIVQDMHPDDRLVLVERNEEFVDWLRRRFAESFDMDRIGGRISLLHAAVEDLPEDEPFDLIVSGLPLNNFTIDVVQQIFNKLRRLLTAGGILSFFEYVAIRRVKSLVSISSDRARLRGISQVFEEQLRGNEVRRDLVLANVPPAWVHHVRFTAANNA
jgi:phospholipid N-methyltransferase